MLFEEEFDSGKNLLPYGGTVLYFGKIFSEIAAREIYDYLLNEIPWKPDEAVIFGKVIETRRKIAWYGEREFSYTYSGRTKSALPFNEQLLKLKARCEAVSGESFNSCLVNLYHDGSEGMAWHSDAEKDLKKNGAIASLSFGAERKFSFKHKSTKEKIDINLPSGSLLIMKDETQSNWLHRLPPTKKPLGPRINLTFRTIDQKAGKF